MKNKSAETENFDKIKSSVIIEKRMESIQYKSMLRSLFLKIIIVVAAVVCVFVFVFGVSIQTGEGMFPRIRDGDIILYYRFNPDIQTGDVITYCEDGVRYCGRVVAKPGDSVNDSDEGKLIINGAIQYEEIYYDTFTDDSKLSYPYKVPDDSYFVLGDMRTGATDSRDFGAISKDDIDGKIITIIRRRGI